MRNLIQILPLSFIIILVFACKAPIKNNSNSEDASISNYDQAMYNRQNQIKSFMDALKNDCLKSQNENAILQMEVAQAGTLDTFEIFKATEEVETCIKAYIYTNKPSFENIPNKPKEISGDPIGPMKYTLPLVKD